MNGSLNEFLKKIPKTFAEETLDIFFLIPFINTEKKLGRTSRVIIKNIET